MMQINIDKGLDLPILGDPLQIIHEDANPVRTVGLLGRDYLGLKPSILVQEGERVKIGQALFFDKRNPLIKFTAPAAGVVSAIHRGAKRVLQSVEITIDSEEESLTFPHYNQEQLLHCSRQQIQENLLNSGLWTALKTRPYSKIPDPETSPNSIFITAMDTNPLAANPTVIIAQYAEDFKNGIVALTRLTEGTVFVCQAPEANVPIVQHKQVQYVAFAGTHPAGLPGTHIHFLDPVNAHKTVWTIAYQEVIAIGKLLTTGKLWCERIIALAGPVVHRPRLIRTRLGANTEELVANELTHTQERILSGSVFSGHRVAQAVHFLGRYHTQITAIEEAKLSERELLGWLRPGEEKFSVINLFISSLKRATKKFAFNTNQNGNFRAMVPFTIYDEIMPLDILTSPLLRALLVSDTDMAQALGCLELDEEDLALCTFVCVGKYEYGPILRANLDKIEREG
jgi:Na+-transporting NADH:ubiquinone oxidoreductase subunit A